MPFEISLYAKKPSENWQDPKPPLLEVPEHRVSWKRDPGPDNLSKTSELRTYSSSDLALTIGGTFPAAEFAAKAAEAAEWVTGSDLEILAIVTEWVRLYPGTWFENG
jgi:hypothetical protein